MNAAEIAAKLAEVAPEVAAHLLPNGRRRGREFEVGSVDGAKGGSLKMRLVGAKAGLWSDFATGERGDPLDLWAASRRISIRRAMAEAAAWLGLPAGSAADKTKAPADPPSTSLVMPIPPDAPPLDAEHSFLGRSDCVFTYYGADDRSLFHICRWEATTFRRKQFRPLTLHRRAGALVWAWEGPPAPRPLYRLNDLAAHPERPVLLLEGEGKANAVRDLGLELCPASWPGGAGGTSAADLSPLAGRTVICRADNDEAGRDAMVAIGWRLWTEHGVIARLVDLPSGLKVGFDLADPWPADWKLATVERLIDEARPFDLSNHGRTT